MSKLEFDFYDILERINFIYRNEEIYVDCVKDYHSFSLGESKFGPFEKGKRYRMKLFLAIPFIENDILKVATNDKYDNIVVQRYAITERDDQKLVKQEIFYFLNKLKEFKAFVEIDVKSGKKTKIDLDRYNSYKTNVIDSRLLKLLRMATSDINLQDEGRFTNSEKILFDRIQQLLKIWKSHFL